MVNELSKELAKSRKATALQGIEAWWYVNKKSIEVYVRDADGVSSARLTRAQLERALELMESALTCGLP